MNQRQHSRNREHSQPKQSKQPPQQQQQQQQQQKQTPLPPQQQTPNTDTNNNNNNQNNQVSNKELQKQAKQSKQIEQQQQQQQLKLDKEKEKRDFEQKKVLENKGIDESFTLVENSLGHLEKRNDLDKFWVDSEPLRFIPFIPDDNENVDNQDADETLLQFNSLLSKLLKMKYNVFWSHILYNQSLVEFIDSFLCYYNRPYKPVDICGSVQSKPSTKEYQESKRLLFKRVLSVIVRMSQNQEKATLYIDRDYYIKAMSTHSIFDVPRIIDICSLFAMSSKEVVVDLVQRIFDYQPALYDQLSVLVNPMVKRLQELQLSIIQIANIDLLKIESSCKVLLDLTYTIDCLLRVHLMATHSFHPTTHHSNNILVQEFVPLLVYYYEKILPLFIATTPLSSKPKVTQVVNTIQSHILGIINSILKHIYINKIDKVMQSLSEPCNQCINPKRITMEELSKMILDFLGKLISYPDYNKEKQSKTVSETIYQSTISILYDFEQKFNLSIRLNQLLSLNQNMDLTQFNYIMSIMGKQSNNSSSKGKTTSTTSSTSSSSTSIDPKEKQNLAQVKEIFPDLGDGFVISCLKHYSNNVENTINALFEDNLPSNLKSLNRNMKLEDLQKSSSAPTSTSTTTTTTSTSAANNNKNSNSILTKLTNQVYHMNIGKKSADLSPNLAASRSYITKNYDTIYDDEYDDSLDVFLGMPVDGDGETLDDEATEEKKKKQEPSSLVSSMNQEKSTAPPQPQQSNSKKPPQHGKGSPHHHKNYDQKSHNRKDLANKKKGSFPPPQ